MSIEEQDLEKRIIEKGLTAPRLTPALIDSVIIKEEYIRIEGTTTTICVLHLKNGYLVKGSSASVSKENFDEEIGKEIARKNAREEIWALEGYLLAEKMHDISRQGSKFDFGKALYAMEIGYKVSNDDFPQGKYIKIEGNSFVDETGELYSLDSYEILECKSWHVIY